MADNRITKQRIKNHWAYSWWKYLVMCVCVVFGVNMFFTMTAYRSPENKKVELYLCSGWADSELAYADMWPMLQEVAPDQEELIIMNIDLVGQEYYTIMQFTTYIAAQQGDVMLLPKSEFAKYASEDAWGMYAELTPYLEGGMLSADDIDLTRGKLENASGEIGVFGIPADTLYGLTDYGVDPADTVLVVTAFSGNEETCVKLVDAMVKRYKTEKPDFYDEWHNSRTKKNTTTLFN
ncbi:MAG: hypothetical protein IJ337_04780, partial [Clostridia bacterium]|nr:hypothetical protein [Clostridia bacterium]